MFHKSRSYKIFLFFNYTFLAVLSFICIAPMIHILAVSFSGTAAANGNLVVLWPVDFTMDAYKETIGNRLFLRAVWNAVARTILGTAATMVVLVLAAFSLSKEEGEFKGRTFYIWFFVFTMLFSGGLIPTYILVYNVGLINSIWSLILPGMINAFNLVLLMNFFRTSVPKSLEEAAYMDGAGHFKTIFFIYLPISMPAIATITLFTLVGHWNSWFDGMIYMTKAELQPLATFLQTIIVQQDLSKLNVTPEMLRNLSNRTVKAAQIFIAALPVLIVYPLLQRYFVKGIVLGAVKE